MAEHLDADVDRYLQAATLNLTPPAVVSDPLVGGATPVEQLLRVLGLAANSGDPEDNADSAGLHAQRDAWTTDAAGSFAEQDTTAAQQIPQLASGIAGGVAATVTGLLAPLIQLPQQFAQAAGQAVQATTSLADRRHPHEIATDPGADSGDVSAADTIDPGDPALPAEVGAMLSPVPQPTVAAAAPGPPPVASAATHPSSSVATPFARVTAGPPVAAPAAAMTGMPLMPPAAAPSSAPESKVDTKRVTTAGPAVTTRIDGKPAPARPGRNESAAQ